MSARWSRLGPPLRPSAPDLDIFQWAIDQQAKRITSPRWQAMLQGVTPEIAALNWPENCELIAVDRASEMIGGVWPGDTASRRAVCADWFDFLPATRGFEVIVGDGNFNTLRLADEFPLLTQLIHDALVPGGVFCVRFLTTPKTQETISDVVRTAHAGQVSSFHGFKVRLLMAAQSSPGSGVIVGDVWKLWESAHIDTRALHASTGWPVEEIATIELYRNSRGFLCFPSLEQALTVWGKWFAIEMLTTPPYPLGKRCPTLILRKKGTHS